MRVIKKVCKYCKGTHFSTLHQLIQLYPVRNCIPAGYLRYNRGPLLALGRKNYLFCGNHDAAVRAAIVYSLFTCCKAAGIETRTWLEDVLKRLPSEKDPDALLPATWAVTNRQ